MSLFYCRVCEQQGAFQAASRQRQQPAGKEGSWLDATCSSACHCQKASASGKVSAPRSYPSWLLIVLSCSQHFILVQGQPAAAAQGDEDKPQVPEQKPKKVNIVTSWGQSSAATGTAAAAAGQAGAAAAGAGGGDRPARPARKSVPVGQKSSFPAIAAGRKSVPVGRKPMAAAAEPSKYAIWLATFTPLVQPTCLLAQCPLQWVRL